MQFDVRHQNNVYRSHKHGARTWIPSTSGGPSPGLESPDVLASTVMSPKRRKFVESFSEIQARFRVSFLHCYFCLMYVSSLLLGRRARRSPLLQIFVVLIWWCQLGRIRSPLRSDMSLALSEDSSVASGRLTVGKELGSTPVIAPYVAPALWLPCSLPWLRNVPAPVALLGGTNLLVLL